MLCRNLWKSALLAGVASVAVWCAKPASAEMMRAAPQKSADQIVTGESTVSTGIPVNHRWGWGGGGWRGGYGGWGGGYGRGYGYGGWGGYRGYGGYYGGYYPRYGYGGWGGYGYGYPQYYGYGYGYSPYYSSYYYPSYGYYY